MKHPPAEQIMAFVPNGYNLWNPTTMQITEFPYTSDDPNLGYQIGSKPPSLWLDLVPALLHLGIGALLAKKFREITFLLIFSEALFKNGLSKKNRENLLVKLTSILDVVTRTKISFTAKNSKNTWTKEFSICILRFLVIKLKKFMLHIS